VRLFVDSLRETDPIVGLAITLVILKITWDSWQLVSSTDPGDVGVHERFISRD
jgi:hypothetical protein